jgi:cytochrome c5
MKQIKPFLIAFLLLGAVACSTTKKSTSADSKGIKTEPSALTAELKQGQDLFVGKCGKCHDLPVLASHDAEGWKKVLDVMGPKAKLDAAQTDLVYRYITNK